MYFTDKSYENEVISSEAMEEASSNPKEQMESSSRSLPRSPAWSFFTKQSSDPNLADCNLCGQEVPTRNYGTTGLFSHLRRHHAEEVEVDKLPRIPVIPDNKVELLPPVVKKNRTNASPVWQHFTRDGGKGVCSSCGLEVAVPSGSTTGMFAHLRKYHPVLYRQAKFKKLSISGFVPAARDSRDSAQTEPLAINMEFILPERLCEITEDLDGIDNDDSRDDKTETVLVKSNPEEQPGLLILERLRLAYVTQECSDLVFHCEGGTVSSHKLVMAGLSHHLKNLLLSCDQEEVHVFLPHIKLYKMEEFLINVYGDQQTPIEEFREIFDILMIFKTCESFGRNELNSSNVEDCIDCLDSPASLVIPPCVKKEPLNLGTNLDTQTHNEFIVNNYQVNISPIENHNTIDEENNVPAHDDYLDDENEESIEIEDPEWFPDMMPSHKTVMEMPNMQELDNKQINIPHRTKKSSLIWVYFDKTSELITCRICGVKIKNSGNTTNAAHHLKQHPTEYTNFKNDSMAQKQEIQRESNKRKEEQKSNSQSLRLEWVWNNFSFPEKEHVAVCNVCKDEIVVNHISNDAEHLFLAHLQHTHAEVYLDGMISMNKLEEINKVEANNVEGFFLHGDLEFNRVCRMCQTVVQAKDGSVEEMVHHMMKDHPNESLKPPAAVVKRKKKKLTAIWLYFSKGEDEEERICQICGIVVRAMNASTTGMITHLRAYHKSQFAEWQKLRGSGSGPSGLNRNTSTKTVLPKNSSRKFVRKRGRKANEAILANAPEIRTCADCGKVFSCRGAMQYHCRVVHSGVRPFNCEFCGKTFARKDSYDSHITQHNAVKPFMCQHCGKTFGRRHTRDVHERSHIGDRRYTCAYCPKKFMSGQQKIAHERVHTGEKPYQCTNCGKTFAQQHQLVTHFRIHSGEKPYHCPKCGQHFRHLSSHRNHRCASPTSRQMHTTSSTPQQMHTIVVQNSEPMPSDPDEAYREQEADLPAQYRLNIVSHAPVPTILKYC